MPAATYAQLTKLSVENLKDVARENDLKGYSKLNKENLVKFLIFYGVEDPSITAEEGSASESDEVQEVSVPPSTPPAKKSTIPPNAPIKGPQVAIRKKADVKKICRKLIEFASKFDRVKFDRHVAAYPDELREGEALMGVTVDEVKSTFFE